MVVVSLLVLCMDAHERRIRGRICSKQEQARGKVRRESKEEEERLHGTRVDGTGSDLCGKYHPT